MDTFVHIVVALLDTIVYQRVDCIFDCILFNYPFDPIAFI